MGKINLHCNRKVNSITCICGYIGTYHISDLVIAGTITKDFYPGNCKNG